MRGKEQNNKSPRKFKQKTLTAKAEEGPARTGSMLPHFLSMCFLRIGRGSTSMGISGTGEGQLGEDPSQQTKEVNCGWKKRATGQWDCDPVTVTGPRISHTRKKLEDSPVAKAGQKPAK